MRYLRTRRSILMLLCLLASLLVLGTASASSAAGAGIRVGDSASRSAVSNSLYYEVVGDLQV